MTGTLSLAVLGAKPRFGERLQVGQFYWPQWEKYELAARGIFSRRYYTAQRFAGPLVVEFERRLSEFLGVKHAVVVRNATNALMIAAHTLGLRGKVIVPSWTSIATIQSLLWSNCQPVFCDIERDSQQISPDSVRRLLEAGRVKGILGVHLWGNAAPVRELEALASDYGVALYYDAAHAFGCRVNGTAIGRFGRAEAFSFHASNILSTAEGGCLTTSDDALAATFKAMRGDHVPATGISVQSATARMSEIQAAVGLVLLDEFDRHRRSNEEQYQAYERWLGSIPGIGMMKRLEGVSSNFQHFVAVVKASQFGLTRDELLAVLKAENVAAERYFYPACHSLAIFSAFAPEDKERLRNTELAAQTTLQLPIGGRVTIEHIERICDVINEAHVHADFIRSKFGR